jgi:DNA-binding NarL/FixJ family response regulator
LVTVAVLDKHPIVRHGIEEILGRAADLHLIISVGSIADLNASLCTGRRPDLIMMDLYLDGTPALPTVSELAMVARVLVISASRRAGDVLGAIRAGAAGYVTKQSAPELIVTAIHTIVAGGFLLSADLVGILQTALPTGGDDGSQRPAHQARLSPREEQTLSYVAGGFTHSQIATRLGVSTTTVDTYVQRIRTKLGVGNKAQLTLAALTHVGLHAAPLRRQPD